MSLPAYQKAIQSIESGGNYGVVGPTHPKYGRALGAYQVMEANLPEWSQAALGRKVSADEFLGNKDLQDQIFNNRFGGYVSKYGNPQDAASAWFTGRPRNAQSGAAKDSLGTSGNVYVDKFNKALGADGGPAGDMAISGQPMPTSEADMPAADGQIAQGGFAVPKGPPGFMEGGPGAWFGAPQEGWNAGDALMGAGASLMARDNPKGAAALAAQVGSAKKNAANLQFMRDPNTGAIVSLNPQTGQIGQKTQVFDPPTKKEEELKLPTQKFFQQNVEVSNLHSEMADKFDMYRRALANGEMDLSVLEGAKKTFAEITNAGTTPQQKLAVRFALDMEKMRNDKLLEAKGVQTEGDSQRAMNAIMPGQAGRYNNDQVLEALDLGFKNSAKNYNLSVKSNETIYNKWKDKVAYDGYDSGIKANQDRYTKADQEFVVAKETYQKRRATESDTSKESVGGRSGDKTQPAQTGGSFAERHRQRMGQ